MASICLKQNLSPRQVNLTISKEEMSLFGKLKVYFWHDLSACGYYRCYMPALYLQKAGFCQTASSYDDQIQIEMNDDINPYVRGSSNYEGMKVEKMIERIEWADIIVLQRMGGSGTQILVEKIKKAGKPYVHEVDDMCERVPLGNPSHWYWKNEVVLQNHAFGFKNADLVTTTNEALANFYRKEYGRPTWVLPSQLDLGMPRWCIDYKKGPGVVIGWLCSESHAIDHEVIKPAVEYILETHPECRFEFLGWAPDWIRGLPRCIQKECSLIKVPEAISGWDIGLAPIVDNEFNSIGKCDIKFLEYAGGFVASLMANLRPYTETVQNMANGLLAQWDDPDDWKWKLEKLVKRQQLRLNLAQTANNWVYKERVYATQCVLWYKAYHALIAGKSMPQ